MLLNVFIALIICSTCFGHLYAHHQELDTILVLLPHVVCNALVAGGRNAFIALIICSTCFGHLYANHQELGTILVLLLHMVCNALVAGGRLLGAEQQAIL